MKICLIAHNSKTALMQNFCIAYQNILNKHDLYATKTTAYLIEEVTNLKIHKYVTGYLGEIQQLGAQISHHDVDALIFLREAENPPLHDSSYSDVIKLCDTYNIPLATNLATAETIVLSLANQHFSLNPKRTRLV